MKVNTVDIQRIAHIVSVTYLPELMNKVKNINGGDDERRDERNILLDEHSKIKSITDTILDDSFFGSGEATFL